MKQDELTEYSEMLGISQHILSVGAADRYLAFIRSCVERLNKGDSVQAIWNDYQQKAQ